MRISRFLQYAFIAIVTISVGFSLYQWNASRASTAKTAPNNGLVGYWSFNEGAGTLAGDSSVNKNTGTLTNGPTWVSGKLGQAVSLDGVNDYITMGDQSSLEINNNSFSFGGWFYLNAYPSAFNRMFLITKGTTGSYEYELTVNEYSSNSNKFTATLFTTTTATYITAVSNTVPPLNTWFHVMGVWDKDAVSMKIYYNGVLENTSTSTYETIHTTRTANFEIGRRGDNAEAKLNGNADEVRVYNRALSGTEVTNLYNLGAAKLDSMPITAGPKSGLAGIWSFNTADMSGTTAYDRSGNANNGTLTNGPAATSGKNSQAMSFDGTDDYMDAGTSATLQPAFPFSLSLWVKRATSGQVATVTTGAPGGAGVYSGYTLTVGADLSVQVGNNTGDCVPGSRYTMVTSSAPVTAGSWHHVVVIFTAIGNFRAFVDGVNVTMIYSGGGAGSLVYGAGARFRVNSLYSCSTTSYQASSVDDVRVYNRELSYPEIQTLANSGNTHMNTAASFRSDFTTNLTGYWNLDDNTGTTATDSSVNAKNGTLTNGPTWGTGKSGSDVVFDGTDDYIDLGTTSTGAFNYSGDVSGAAWVKTSTSGRMILLYQNGNPLIYMSVGPTSVGGTANKLVLYLRTNFGSFYSFSGEATITDGAWHHVAFSRDTQTQKVRLYVDGAVDNISAYTDTTAINTSGGTHIISHGSTYAFNGQIDDVRMYNRVLSPSEVKELSLLMPADTSLKGYWSFNGPDISGTTAYDRSGNANNGTLTNGPTPAIGKSGQALRFDGVNDAISAPLNLSGTNVVSVSFWLKWTAFANDDKLALEYTNNFGGKNGFLVDPDDSTAPTAGMFSFGTSEYYSTLFWTDAFTRPSAGVWHHYVLIMNRATPANIAYVDGVLQSLTTQNHSAYGMGNFDNSSLYFMSRGTTSLFGNGSLDEVRIYNRALSATEVAALYNSGR